MANAIGEGNAVGVVPSKGSLLDSGFRAGVVGMVNGEGSRVGQSGAVSREVSDGERMQGGKR
jgi:hypothetical protein